MRAVDASSEMNWIEAAEVIPPVNAITIKAKTLRGTVARVVEYLSFPNNARPEEVLPREHFFAEVACYANQLQCIADTDAKDGFLPLQNWVMEKLGTRYLEGCMATILLHPQTAFQTLRTRWTMSPKEKMLSHPSGKGQWIKSLLPPVPTEGEDVLLSGVVGAAAAAAAPDVSVDSFAALLQTHQPYTTLVCDSGDAAADKKRPIKEHMCDWYTCATPECHPRLVAYGLALEFIIHQRLEGMMDLGRNPQFVSEVLATDKMYQRIHALSSITDEKEAAEAIRTGIQLMSKAQIEYTWNWITSAMKGALDAIRRRTGARDWAGAMAVAPSLGGEACHLLGWSRWLGLPHCFWKVVSDTKERVEAQVKLKQKGQMQAALQPFQLDPRLDEKQRAAAVAYAQGVMEDEQAKELAVIMGLKQRAKDVDEMPALDPPPSLLMQQQQQQQQQVSEAGISPLVAPHTLLLFVHASVCTTLPSGMSTALTERVPVVVYLPRGEEASRATVVKDWKLPRRQQRQQQQQQPAPGLDCLFCLQEFKDLESFVHHLKSCDQHVCAQCGTRGRFCQFRPVSVPVPHIMAGARDFSVPIHNSLRSEFDLSLVATLGNSAASEPMRRPIIQGLEHRAREVALKFPVGGCTPILSQPLVMSDAMEQDEAEAEEEEEEDEIETRLTEAKSLQLAVSMVVECPDIEADKANLEALAQGRETFIHKRVNGNGKIFYFLWPNNARRYDVTPDLMCALMDMVLHQHLVRQLHSRLDGQNAYHYVVTVTIRALTGHEPETLQVLEDGIAEKAGAVGEGVKSFYAYGVVGKRSKELLQLEAAAAKAPTFAMFQEACMHLVLMLLGSIPGLPLDGGGAQLVGWVDQMLHLLVEEAENELRSGSYTPPPHAARPKFGRLLETPEQTQRMVSAVMRNEFWFWCLERQERFPECRLALEAAQEKLVLLFGPQMKPYRRIDKDCQRFCLYVDGVFPTAHNCKYLIDNSLFSLTLFRPHPFSSYQCTAEVELDARGGHPYTAPRTYEVVLKLLACIRDCLLACEKMGVDVKCHELKELGPWFSQIWIAGEYGLTFTLQQILANRAQMKHDDTKRRKWPPSLKHLVGALQSFLHQLYVKIASHVSGLDNKWRNKKGAVAMAAEWQAIRQRSAAAASMGEDESGDDPEYKVPGTGPLSATPSTNRDDPYKRVTKNKQKTKKKTKDKVKTPRASRGGGGGPSAKRARMMLEPVAEVSQPPSGDDAALRLSLDSPRPFDPDLMWA